MEEKHLLTVKDLHVNVEDKEILHGVDLTINKGETHVLMTERNRQVDPWLRPDGKSEIQCHRG